VTDKNLTYLTGIMDRSGSMALIKTDTEGGWNTLIEEQAKEPGECLVSLVQFDTVYETVFDYTPVWDVPKYELHPRGSTALLDAIGNTINTLGEKLAAMPEDQRPGSVILVILTDGCENASHEFTAAQIKTMIERQQNDYQWVIQFLGANQDAVTTAKSYGIAASHAMTYDGHNVANSFSSSSANIAAFRTATATGLSHEESVLASSYTDDQRAEAVAEEPSTPKERKKTGKVTSK
jgi:uncharacterized protein YegL